MSIATQLERRLEEMAKERDAAIQDAKDWGRLAYRYQGERDALAAHVERVQRYWMLIDRGVSNYVERAKLNEIIDAAPSTSLARLKDEWQAGFILGLLNNHEEFAHPDVGPVVELLVKLETVLRRQSEPKQ